MNGTTLFGPPIGNGPPGSAGAPNSLAEMAACELAKRTTLRYERIRAVATGVQETAVVSVLLVIAIKFYHADERVKWLIPAGPSLGFLLSPAVVNFVSGRGWRATRAAAVLAFIGAAGYLSTVLFPDLPVFLIGSLVALVCGGALVPFLTQMYQDNYPEEERGKLFSSTTMIRIAVATVFSGLAGWFLNDHLDDYPWLMLVFATAYVVSSFCMGRCPSKPLVRVASAHPLHALHWVRDDPLFRMTLIVWMLVGFSNLMMHPMRVEYLGNAKYELALSPLQIMVYVNVIPNIVRLCLSPVWGYLFDRVNFFRMRIAINISFALGIFSFFTGGSFTGLLLGGIFYGIANAGGDLAWSLWVTKIAPPARVAEYMSVHTFCTGLRGVAAPLISYQVVSAAKGPEGMSLLGWCCGGMIVLASLLLIPEALSTKLRRSAPLTGEVSE
jgi:MFS family permease